MPEETAVAPATATETPTQATETPTKTAEEQAAAAAAKPKYKIGEEEFEESALEEIVRKARESDEAQKKADQIRKEGYKKFEEAAKVRKQFEKIQALVHENPEAGLVELATILGMSEEVLEKIWSQKADLNKQWEKWTPEQRELYLTQQKLKQLEEERSARESQEKEQKATAEARQKQAEFEKELARDTFPAMQAAGLPQTALHLKLVAATIAALAERNGPDEKPDITEAVTYVADAVRQQLDDSVKVFAKDPKAFVQRYPELAEALRKMSVAEARGVAPGQAPKPPGTQPGAASQPNGLSQEKPTAWSDMNKFFRNLQRGGRP